MGLLQQIYMWILNPIYSKTSQIDEQIRERIFFIMMVLLYGSILVWYSINMFGIYFSHTPRMLLECIMFFVAIVFIGDKKLERIKWNNWIAGFWILCGIIIFLMGFVARQNFGYWLIGPIMAFGFPCLYFVLLNQENYKKYIAIICKAVILASLIYFVVALFAEFISDNVWDWSGRYNGTTSDANRIGEICVASFACCIAILVMKEVSSRWKFLSLIVMAFCICDAWISVSRSTLIAIGCMIVYFIMLVAKESLETKNYKEMFTKYISIVCCVVVAFMGTFLLESIHEYALKSKGYEEQAQMTPSLGAVGERMEINDDSDKATAVDRFSSGRITIWSTYLKGVDILGNKADGRTPIAENLTNVSAHNTFIEFSYRSGIIAGALFLIIEILSGVLLLRILFRKSDKNKPQDYFIAFASIGYIIVSNLQVAYNPLTSIIFFIYSISVVVMLEERNRLLNKKDNKKLA